MMSTESLALFGMTGVPEHDAIVQCYALLVNGIGQSPKEISDKLIPTLSANEKEYLASTHPSNSDKARRIVDTVCIQVQVNGINPYYNFVTVLRDAGSWIADVVEELKKTFATLQASTPEYLTLTSTECRTELIELQRESFVHKQCTSHHYIFKGLTEVWWKYHSEPEHNYQNLSIRIKMEPSLYYKFLNQFTWKSCKCPSCQGCQVCKALEDKSKSCLEKLKKVYHSKKQDEDERYRQFMMTKLKESDSQHRRDLWMWQMYSEKWDQRFQELLKQETTWSDNAFHQTRRAWENVEGELRQREQQSIKWDQLTESQLRQYAELEDLAKQTTEVTQEDLKKAFETMSRVKCYKERSSRAQQYLGDLNDHLSELNSCKAKMQSFKEGLERSMKEMGEMIKNLEARKDPALTSALEECQKKYEDCSRRLEECQRQLDAIDVSAKMYGEERQRALKNLSDLQLSLSESATELKQFSERVCESQQELTTEKSKKAGAFFNLNAIMFIVVFSVIFILTVFILTRTANDVITSVAGKIFTGLLTAFLATLCFIIGMVGGTQDEIITAEEKQQSRRVKDKLDHIQNNSKQLAEIVDTAKQEIDTIQRVVSKGPQ